MDTPESPSLSRRQLMAVCMGGSLTGAAWAVAFREASGRDDVPAVTTARDLGAVAMLIEHRASRILALDSPAPEKTSVLTEQVMGMTRQRVDVLLATSRTLSALPGGYLDRWAIAWAPALPDDGAGFTEPLGDRRLTINELDVQASGLPLRRWIRSSPQDSASWYLTATFGASRLTLASDASALKVTPFEPAYANVVICTDPDVETPAGHPAIDALYLPSESAALREEPASTTRLVPIFRNLPVSLRLERDRVRLPVDG
jgi:hypothetical protein